MIQVQLCHNGVTTIHTFTNLLDGLYRLKVVQAVFDYIIIDNDTTVLFAEFDAYFAQLNDYCRRVCGMWYE